METSNTSKYDIIVEGSSLAQSTNLNTALIDLFSTCFVFDIAYPFEVAPIFIFLQHYVFALKDGQKLPVSVTITVATMCRLSVGSRPLEKSERESGRYAGVEVYCVPGMQARFRLVHDCMLTCVY